MGCALGWAPGTDSSQIICYCRAASAEYSISTPTLASSPAREPSLKRAAPSRTLCSRPGETSGTHHRRASRSWQRQIASTFGQLPRAGTTATLCGKASTLVCCCSTSRPSVTSDCSTASMRSPNTRQPRKRPSSDPPRPGRNSATTMCSRWRPPPMWAGWGRSSTAATPFGCAHTLRGSHASAGSATCTMKAVRRTSTAFVVAMWVGDVVASAALHHDAHRGCCAG
mmetsp:Transcript_5895/g.19469  ORF Transcript_5895/g.19469 Transcript_5895/m.19469 type:complete len:226 (+) Transcript_5895:546-1223(+)